MKKIMIAGTHSGVGKTTVTLGIMKSLTQMGYKVQPYKAGPDYIDPSYHKYVTGRNSRNLDSYMLDEEQMKYIMMEASSDADISIIEGVMGLYDGLGIDLNNSTSSYISKVMKCPVILVIDGKSVISSAAAMVKGFVELDREVMIVGVIVNNIKRESHYKLIKEAIEKYCGIEVIGYLPPIENLKMESRHLGLIPALENQSIKESIENLAKIIVDTVDINRIFELSESENLTSSFELSMITENDEIREMARGKKVAIAYDEAFNFYYEENLSLLKKIGLELVYFSPLRDKELPECDILYLGGGFPEVFADQLSSNKSMLKSIKQKSDLGLAIYAECGGIMYLGKKLVDKEGKEYEMVGALDGVSYMTNSLKRFGYCVGTAKRDNLMTNKGESIRGHEFHYSVFKTDLETEFTFVKERDGKVVDSWEGGYAYKNTLASYNHIHFYNNLNTIFNLLKHIQ